MCIRFGATLGFRLTCGPDLLMFSRCREGQDSQITGTGWIPVGYPTTGQNVDCEAATDVDVRVRRRIVEVQTEEAVRRSIIPVTTVIKSCPKLLFRSLDPSTYDFTNFIDVRTPYFIPMDIHVTQSVTLSN